MYLASVWEGHRIERPVARTGHGFEIILNQPETLPGNRHHLDWIVSSSYWGRKKDEKREKGKEMENSVTIEEQTERLLANHNYFNKMEIHVGF